MSDCLTRYEMLAFVGGVVDSDDNNRISAHIEVCDKCTDLYDEVFVSQVMLLSPDDLALNDGAVLEYLDDDGSDTESAEVLRGIEDHLAHVDRDARAADALFVQLVQHPVDAWPDIIGANPLSCTAALVQRLVDAATPELDRKPEHALVLLQVAETVAATLRGGEGVRSRGHVWKQRSNAYRMAARYDEAIDAARVAEAIYAELRDPDTNFEVGQARYAIAATLTKMTRYEAALRMLESARRLLDEYSETAPLAKAMMLEATIRLEQGDVITARQALRALVPIEQRLGQQLELGRVRFNLAECNLRLGELDAAMEDVSVAIDIFRNLGNVAEQTRCEWTLVVIRLARREASAVRDLEPIAATYQRLGMPGEAGLVTLDLTEQLLQNEQWTEAENLARRLVTLFMEAGVTVASVNALHFLRIAVENREASAETVRYIRAYITADDPEQPFAPPLVRAN
jgi:tetratricopeptide (TPR) repeat protein